MSQSDFSAKFPFVDKCLPPKEKISKQWFTEPPQRYSGDILNHNIHGNGFYFAQNNGKVFYDGLFYANKLEGYSQIFYGNGSHFQGLFKGHKRLGPGVLTYRNGEQDVGLWDGFSLARLETVVEPNVVPMLGNSVTGKVKLVRYRYLVPVCPEAEDVALEVLANLEANDRVVEGSCKLYNLEVENKDNLFFYKKIFDEKFYTKQDCLIDIMIPEEENEEEMETMNRVEEEEQEECVKGSSTDSERIRQISDELELIECKLEAVRRVKKILAKKVEYCRICCFGIQGEECVSPFEEGTRHDNDYSSSHQSTDYGNLEEYNNVNPESLQEDALSKIEEYLLGHCDCSEAIHIGDLAALEKQLQMIEDDEIFYETLKGNLHQKLKYHLKKSEMCSDVKTKQVVVTELLAWNNEELLMNMLKHSFLHRRSEYMVTFNVSSLLKGNREEFSAAGLHESHCIEFLTNCTNGAVKNLLDTIRVNKINVNMCDARGNSGIFFAAANGKVDVVPILVNFGAKLDQVNDEGLTPLLLCLLIYLAMQNDRFDWESSFLPEFQPPLESQRELPKWYQNKSILSLHDTQSIKSPSKESISLMPACDNRILKMRLQKTNSQMAVKENYLFNTSFVDYKEPKKKGKAKGKAPKKEVPEPPPSPEMLLKEEGKKVAAKTIYCLLDHGANPNIGEVPLPPLLLAVFSENPDIVESIAAAKVDVDIAMIYCLTALHVVVSLRCVAENIDICRVLLEYGADTNLRTSTNHWPERKTFVLGKGVKPDACEDLGKNPLHTLCLRKDFPTDSCEYFSNIATMLLRHDINPHDLYLGHTGLSLAVLTGNLNVVEAILNLKPLPLNPHLVLGYNMGNVLTLYILKRYNNVLPLDKCMQMLKLLVDKDVNLLRPIDDFENAIAFMDKEHEIIKDDKGKGKKGKKDKSSKSSKKSDKSSKKGKKKGKQPPQEVLKEYLKELARDTIIKYIQFEAVRHLYNLAEAQMLDFDFTKILAEFLNPSLTLEILALLFNTGKIKHARFNKEICLLVVEFVEKYQKVVKKKKEKTPKAKKDKGKKDKKSKGSSSKSSTSAATAPSEPPPPTYSDIIDATNYEKMPRDKSKIKLKRPGLDDTSKYMVCFHCLKRINKVLLACPRCQYIYYCSEQCNKLNVKMKAQHACKMNFYKNLKKQLEAGTLAFSPNIHEICKIASVACEDMLVRRREAEEETLRRAMEEENRLDVYGTRFIKNRRAKSKFSQAKYLPSATTSATTSMCPTEKLGLAVMTPLEQKLTRLSTSRDERYVDMMNRRHESSLLGATEPASLKLASRGRTKTRSCTCMDDTLLEEGSEKLAKRESNVEYYKPRPRKVSVPVKLDAAQCVIEPEQIIRKLRKIPSKYQYFIELLSSCFPDVDLSFLFLPYACYCNGQLYYKFLDENIFSKTYSMI